MADAEAPQVQGLVVIGRFKGVKAPAPYTIDGRSGMSSPKIGIEDDEGNVFRVTATQETYAEWLKKPRGSFQIMPVMARAFIDNGRAQVRLSDRGLSEDKGDAGWE